VLAGHRAFGRLKGSIGAWMLDRAFAAEGEEALSPPVDQRGFAGFAYEELSWPHVTVQFGGRIDRTKFDPQSGPARDFTEASTSAGLLLQPAAANDRLTIAFSVALASRNPALEELYFLGEHLGNFAFEIGNPELESERGLGFDVSLRWRTNRASGEVTYFRNAIDDYIFRNPITTEEFEARLPEFEARFPDRDLEDGSITDLQIIEYTARDSLLQGIEAHTDLTVLPQLVAEVGIDYVRGSLRDTGDPLPRIPPLRFRGGLRYQFNAFQAGGEVVHAAEQDRVFGDETPTDGYTLGKIFGSYSFGSGGKTTSTITARLDNVSNTTYRNHLSLIKDLVPEMGRNFKLLYNVRF
jgi:iron complex outermembrane receptor protein